ncbi:chymotrypsin-2-like [Pollicipes pollicipes]|uniref:chymotrypsin-2-like n=1 Tax=Pollicipes pollicipes TaxID=41117 RepID=UPI001884F6B3|nr:chymotrypsin-2-like [Pollicipes pollicipes]
MFDFSLLRLDLTIVLDSRVAPGWANTLLEVVLPVWTQRRCAQVWRRLLCKSTICAGGLPSGGKDVCKSDSGGPLVTSVSGRYTLIDTASFVNPCAIPKIHGIAEMSSTSLDIEFRADSHVEGRGYLCNITVPAADCCGQVNRRSRVVGGTETGVNEYPWQAGLAPPGGTRTFCGGSVINNRYVLTAAHCTEEKTASQIQVLLGDHRIGVPDGESRYSVVQILDHPQYVNVTIGFDFSLLRLDRNIVFDSRVAPVCLPQAGQTYAGVSAVATGFGRTGVNMPQANTLLEVELSVWTQANCKRVWNQHLKDSMICAGGVSSGGKGVCEGDSGGPLVTSVSDRYALIGIVSFGFPCARPNVPDVFARVTSVLSWIQENTADAALCG